VDTFFIVFGLLVYCVYFIDTYFYIESLPSYVPVLLFIIDNYYFTMTVDGRNNEDVVGSQSKILINYLKSAKKKYGEVIFLVGTEEERIEESLVILQAYSSVFRDLFNEDESTFRVSVVIKVPEFQPKIFRIFLQVQNHLKK